MKDDKYMEKKNIEASNNLNPISRTFMELKQKGHKAFIPFITCGFPDMEGFMRTFEVLDRCGSDIIEIGIPFSDPLSDGPVIQKTSKIAINNGINTDSVFEAVSKIRSKSNTPIVLLVYYNMVYAYGVDKFLTAAGRAGVNGLIIPDLPLEEFEACSGYFNSSSIDNIMIASLTSDISRLCDIGRTSRGFVYCVSLKGVTGTREGLSGEVEGFLEDLRSVTELPLALGFGLSSAGQVVKIKDKCDGIIMGSKLLDIILKADDLDKGLKELEKFVSEIINILKP
jgi:tryptophan synthase alpha chain